MKYKTKVIMILSMVLGISLICTGTVILASSLEMFMFVESLQVEEFKPDDVDSYAVDVLDGGARTASIYIRAEHPIPQTLNVPVLVSIWHGTGETEIDTLFLKFSVETGFIEVYLEVPEGSWLPIRFHQSSDGKGAIFETDDLGILGSGTVTLRFLLKPWHKQQSFDFEVKFSMHKKAFLQLTRQEVWAHTEIPILT